MPSSGLAIRRVLILKIATCGGTRTMSTGLARRANKIYAVKVGRVPGIYASWAEAEAQVEGALLPFQSAGRRGYPIRALMPHLLSAFRPPPQRLSGCCTQELWCGLTVSLCKARLARM